MIINQEIRNIIEKKAELYDSTREQVVERIKSYVRTAINNLRKAEEELLGAVDIAFEDNPFSDFLFNDNYTKSDIRRILSKEIRSDFGPNEEMINNILDAIEIFKYSHRKSKKMLFDSTPQNLTSINVTNDTIDITWDKVDCDCFYEVEVKSPSNKNTYQSLKSKYTLFNLTPGIECHIRVRAVMALNNNACLWSDSITVRTEQNFSECIWKECPDNADEKSKYSVDSNNPRIATKVNGDYSNSTIIGSVSFPLNKVTSWTIKILKLKYNNRNSVLIGVAPSDISQNEKDNSNKCGWYFNCKDSSLIFGPPHRYKDKEYGPRKEIGEYVHNGDSVGVVMDTTKGELSFVINGVNYGVAYEGIPLDKPLVPCVLLNFKDNSIELDPSKVKENVDSSIFVPFIITAKGVAWDSITITWDPVARVLFYQIEIDGSDFWYTTTASFMMTNLLPETEHSFRVRAMKKNSVSKWSNTMKGRTLKKSFVTSRWEKYSDRIFFRKRYSVDENNPRIATKFNADYYCSIIKWNTPLLLNTIISWKIKILKSRNNNGNDIYIGIAPFNINKEKDNLHNCGWYFDCYNSTLCSGPSHNSKYKEYGPKKIKRKYGHTGDNIGVIMDTIKGELSFILGGINLGVAYDRIPLDKPLVPCVLLGHNGDSIELDPSGVERNQENNSVLIPTNITAKDITWESISLLWDEVEGASFYQIEVDKTKPCDSSTTNSFTKPILLPNIEHSFRVRVIKGDSVSEWSDTVIIRTPKEPLFERCIWKECPDDVDSIRKYSVDANNHRIASKVNNVSYCTIIGSAPLPSNKMTSWNIKILKSKDNDGNGIIIGVAPFDIDQNDIHKKYGWYFDCYKSALRLGPPHKHGKEYGPRKEKGQYVYTGDSVGAIMDTTKGELSFILNGVNLGIAYDGIRLDKPLVPCAFLRHEGDSVELVL